MDKKVSICINFLFNAKWRSIAWLSMIWNLHIFISIQQICHLVNAKRKVNIPVFTSRNSHSHSVPEVISGRIHTSLRVFRALGQFREMLKSPQIMGMNKQKVPQNFHPNWSLSNSKIMWGLNLANFRIITALWGIMDPNIPNQGLKYLGVRFKSSTPHFKSNEVHLKCEDHLRIQLL